MIDLILPAERDSVQLQKTVTSVEKYTTCDYKLQVVIEPGLNVSEARQSAMETTNGQYICFIDYDSEMIHSGWLTEMLKVLEGREDAGAVFAGEWWGTEPEVAICSSPNQSACIEVARGPAACMLLDKTRIPEGLKWDVNIGLRNGWLGGDFEEVEYCKQLIYQGLKLYRATNTLFHHTGGKSTMSAFTYTDRFKTVNIMNLLLEYKYAKAPEDDDWFKGLKYVRASSADDCMLAGGSNLRECYKDVIARNGLGYIKSFNRMGIV